MTTVRLVYPRTLEHLMRMSESTDDVLVGVCRPWVARAGIVLALSPPVRDVMLLFMARPGKSPTVDELVSMLYDAREDGGPHAADDAARLYRSAVTRLLPLLGVRRKPGTGWCREIVFGPPPFTRMYTEAPAPGESQLTDIQEGDEYAPLP